MISELEYASKWVERASVVTDPFDRFVYSFFALNALYGPFYVKSERYAIKDLFDELYTEAPQFKYEVKEMLEYPEFQYFIDRKPIQNCRYDASTMDPWLRDTSSDHYKLSEGHWKRSNQSMLMIIYQIRCNLFHGQKQYSRSDDFEIIENASILLLEYMKLFVKYYPLAVSYY